MDRKIEYLRAKLKTAAAIKDDPAADEAFNKLLDLARTYGADTTRFLSAAALKKDIDLYDPRVEKVSMMSMHAAKGLEFPVVFITGCEQDYIPFTRSAPEPCEQNDFNEERRLFYVAMTRAKSQLFLTYARRRNIFGKITDRSLSPFVTEIEQKLINHEKAGDKKMKPKQTQLTLF